MTDESLNKDGRSITWHKVTDYMRAHPEVCKAHNNLTSIELLELIATFYHFEGVFSLKKVTKENVILEDNSKGFFPECFTIKFGDLNRDLKINLIKTLL